MVRIQGADVAQGRVHAGTLSRRVGAPRNMCDYSASLHLFMCCVFCVCEIDLRILLYCLATTRFTC